MLGKHLFVIAAVLTVVAVAVAVVTGGLVTTYDRFELVDVLEGGELKECEMYYESCTCIGPLSVGESYPPQYFCEGFEHCSTMSGMVCPTVE